MSDLTWPGPEQVGVILLNSCQCQLTGLMLRFSDLVFLRLIQTCEWKSIKSPLNPEISDCSIARQPGGHIAGGANQNTNVNIPDTWLYRLCNCSKHWTHQDSKTGRQEDTHVCTDLTVRYLEKGPGIPADSWLTCTGAKAGGKEQ